MPWLERYLTECSPRLVNFAQVTSETPRTAEISRRAYCLTVPRVRSARRPRHTFVVLAAFCIFAVG